MGIARAIRWSRLNEGFRKVESKRTNCWQRRVGVRSERPALNKLKPRRAQSRERVEWCDWFGPAPPEGPCITAGPAASNSAPAIPNVGPLVPPNRTHFVALQWGGGFFFLKCSFSRFCLLRRPRHVLVVC